MLRVPGFAAGLAACVLLLALGGLLHGAVLARRVEDLPEEAAALAFGRRRMAGRVALAASATLFVAWLMLFSAGVPPWAR